MPVRRDNPYANFNFVVEIDGVDSGSFSEVELPQGEIEVIEYREGADPASAARKLPGRATFTNLVLKRGIAGRTELFEWWKSVRDGVVDRRSIAIVLLDEARTPVQRWHLRRAWPVKLSYSHLDGLGNDVAIETLELAHEGFETE